MAVENKKRSRKPYTNHYRLLERGSLQTRDKMEAQRILIAKNEAQDTSNQIPLRSLVKDAACVRGCIPSAHWDRDGSVLRQSVLFVLIGFGQRLKCT